MKPETVDLILAMFRKEEALWYISLLDHDCENVREKLANVRTAEADFKKAVGVYIQPPECGTRVRNMW